MKIVNLVVMLTWILATQIAVAGDKKSRTQSDGPGETVSTVDDLTQAKLITEQFECTVMEVSTQYESASHKSSFHCIEDPGDSANKDGKVFQLVDVPMEFEQIYHSKFSSGGAQLKLRNFYCEDSRLIFTANTIWSIGRSESMNSGHRGHGEY